MLNYKVPFVNYKLQYKLHKKEIDKAVINCLTKGDLIMRKDVEKFEASMRKFFKVKYALGVNSCTDAIFLSLKAIGIKPGDEVITVSHTFLATIEPIVHCGATPVMVDIKEDFTMDEELLEEAITKKTKAIIPVHLNGRMCNMPEIMRLARKYKLKVIEDAAQAHGTTWKGKMAGTLGISGCFSFYPAKILACAGDGGLITTNDDKFAKQILLLRDHGRNRYVSKDKLFLYGFTSRLHNIQAAILNVRNKYIPWSLKRRQEIADRYDKVLQYLPDVILPEKSDDNQKIVYQNYVLKAYKRNELRKYLTKEGIETLVKDPVPNHWQPACKDLKKYNLPVTERLAEEIISLPMYPELTDQQADYVIKCVSNFYATR